METQKPKFVTVDKSLLVIPPSYQRTRRDPKFMKYMAANFDWRLFGTLEIIAREDGKFDVWDGGTRTTVVQGMPAITKVPCMVVSDCTTQEAAKLFVDGNGQRRNINALDMHRARVVAKDPFAISIENMVKDSGYTIKNGPIPFQFQAVSALYSLARTDMEIATKAFDLCAEVAGGEQIPNYVLIGVFECGKKMEEQRKGTLFSDQHIEKLKSVGTKGVMCSINTCKFTSPTASYSKIVCGKGVQEVLNKGRRTQKIKIAW
jgi:hypothetical protein